jgi:ketosteroid isomerase-like protein
MSSHEDLMNHEPAGAIESAYQEHVRRREAGDWTGLASLFAEDARYFDPIFGWQQGRTAIGNFLEGAMAGLAERVFRDMWHVAEGNRLVISLTADTTGTTECRPCSWLRTVSGPSRWISTTEKRQNPRDEMPVSRLP